MKRKRVNSELGGSGSGSGLALQDLLCNAHAAVIVLTMIATAFAGVGHNLFRGDMRDQREGRHAALLAQWHRTFLADSGRGARIVWVHATIATELDSQRVEVGIDSVRGGVPAFMYYRDDANPREHIFQLDLDQPGEWS